MEENQNLFAKVENTPMEQYLIVSKMKELSTWDPCLASVDIGFLGVTISHVTLSCNQYLYNNAQTDKASGSSSLTITIIFQTA